MKRYKYYAILCCLLLVAACHKDDDDKLSPGKYPLEITAHLADDFSRSVGGKDTWTDGERIGLAMYTDVGNFTYTCTIASDGKVSGAPSYWISRNTYVIKAWYPADEQKNVDISDQSGGFTNFDYLYSEAPFEFGKPVTLQFRHVMAKIRVELTTAGNIGVQKVEILSYPTVNYKEEGSLTTSGKGYITACRDGETGNYEALIPSIYPMIATNFIKVTATDGKEYFYSAPNKQLDGGNTYVYKIGVGCIVHYLDNWDITITGDKNHILIGNANGTVTTGRVIVNGNATIELHDVNIAPINNKEAIRVEGGNPTFVLFGQNKLKGAGEKSALYNVPDTEITIQGEGALRADGGENSAGIGGNAYDPVGKIVIKGGDITAQGGNSGGAGIGCGYRRECQGISILGGKITVDGGYGYVGTSGIGKGGASSCAYITLGNCEIHVPNLKEYHGINATTITPSLDDKSALTAAGVKIYVNGKLYND